jgi:hypothetical protein
LVAADVILQIRCDPAKICLVTVPSGTNSEGNNDKAPQFVCAETGQTKTGHISTRKTEIK